MKKITKTFVALFVVFVLVATMACAVACENDPCKDGHTASLVRGTAATCTEGGTQDYYKCAVCNKLFSDAACQNEIQAPIPTQKLGHNTTGNWLFNDNQHYKFCDRCNKNVEAADHTAPNAEGKCSVCGKVLEEKPDLSMAAGTYTIQLVDGEKKWYVTGELNKQGRLLVSTDETKAVIFTVVLTGEVYTIKIGDQYLEAYLNGTYKNLRLVDAPSTDAIQWKWFSEYGTFGATYSDGTRYLSSNYENNSTTALYQNAFSLTEESRLGASNPVKVQYVEADPNAHKHQITYTHDEGLWTHTAKCTDPQCPDSYEEHVACTPAKNVCPDCTHSYTQEEILAKLAELEGGETLPGTYVLTGVIKSIDYPTQHYNNKQWEITVTITVDTTDIQCYNMYGDSQEQLDALKAGDTITVTGQLLHFVKDTTDKLEFNTGCTFKDRIPGERQNPR